jgi:hypothetical protein
MKVIPSFTCHLPNGGTFRRNHLKKLVIATMFNESAYENEKDASNLPIIPNTFSNLAEFIVNTRATFLSRRLVSGRYSIDIIFRNPPYKDMVRPSCDGLWMEFGVYRGESLTDIANWKAAFCGNKSQPVYGFDTFQGLPTYWRAGFDRGAFHIPNETAILVPSNTVLVKGLFIDTLPIQLSLIDREYQCNVPVAFIHIDCDSYESTRDVLFLLESRLVSGSILVFGELFNYPGYEKHEIRALFELLFKSNLRLSPVGTGVDIELRPTEDHVVQSFAFVVSGET